jgi:hypothetical protein
MSENLLNKWLPISQFPYNEDDSLSFKGEPDTWAPNKILLYGVICIRWSNDIPQVYSLDSLYRNEENELRFSTETWRAGSWLEVIPTMYMEVTPPSEQELEDATLS